MNALHNPFVYDDERTILDNGSIRDVWDFRAIALHEATRPIVNPRLYIGTQRAAITLPRVWPPVRPANQQLGERQEAEPEENGKTA